MISSKNSQKHLYVYCLFSVGNTGDKKTYIHTFTHSRTHTHIYVYACVSNMQHETQGRRNFNV